MEITRFFDIAGVLDDGSRLFRILREAVGGVLERHDPDKLTFYCERSGSRDHIPGAPAEALLEASTFRMRLQRRTVGLDLGHMQSVATHTSACHYRVKLSVHDAQTKGSKFPMVALIGGPSASDPHAPQWELSSDHEDEPEKPFGMIGLCRRMPMAAGASDEERRDLMERLARPLCDRQISRTVTERQAVILARLIASTFVEISNG